MQNISGTVRTDIADSYIQVIVDEEKIEQKALWDGLHGVMSNVKEKNMNAEKVLSQYHGLWQVEESFGIVGCSSILCGLFFFRSPVHLQLRYQFLFFRIICFKNLLFCQPTTFPEIFGVARFGTNTLRK